MGTRRDHAIQLLAAILSSTNPRDHQGTLHNPELVGDILYAVDTVALAEEGTRLDYAVRKDRARAALAELPHPDELSTH